MKTKIIVGVISGVLLFGACSSVDKKSPEPQVTTTTAKPVTTTTAKPVTTYYANCAAVRAAGAAPIHRGESGYSSSLDRDGDGIACE